MIYLVGYKTISKFKSSSFYNYLIIYKISLENINYICTLLLKVIYVIKPQSNPNYQSLYWK